MSAELTEGMGFNTTDHVIASRLCHCWRGDNALVKYHVRAGPAEPIVKAAWIALFMLTGNGQLAADSEKISFVVNFHSFTCHHKLQLILDADPGCASPGVKCRGLPGEDNLAHAPDVLQIACRK